MKLILFVTKNLFIDRDWQIKLEKLGYEVFCSNQLLESLLIKNEPSVFDLFALVIFGESVSNDEVSKIVKNSTAKNVQFYRVGEADEDNLSNRMAPEIFTRLNFLHSDISVTELRELLVNSSEIRHTFTINHQDNRSKRDLMQQLQSLLSTKEKELFVVLCKANGEFIPRAELSMAIWNREASQTTLSQLSQIIRRVKTKMRKIGINDDVIQTDWRSGYALKWDQEEENEAYADKFLEVEEM